MSIAIIRAGGKQFSVEKGGTVRVPSLNHEVGASIELEVLAATGDKETRVGTPQVEGAKVIVHARTRELAIARMRRALDAMVIEGIKTTIPLHLKIMDDPDFQAGNISTRFMEDFLARNGVKETPVITASAALTGGSA